MVVDLTPQAGGIGGTFRNLSYLIGSYPGTKNSLQALFRI